MKLKTITLKLKEKIECQVLLMLASHRDCLWNKFILRKNHPDRRCCDSINPNQFTFDSGEGYYGEAFGIMRGLVILGYGYFGSDNMDGIEESKSVFNRHKAFQPEQNMKWWFRQLQNRILKETCYPNSDSSSTYRVLEKYRNLWVAIE